MQTKLAITFGVIMLALIALIVVIYQLVRNNSEEYNKIVLSQRQASYSSRTIPFRRGDIMDRNGTVLATSQKVYNLIIDPRVIHSGAEERYVEPTVKALSEFFGYEEGEIRTLLKDKADKSYVKYAKELSYDQKSGFEEYMKEHNAAYLKAGVKSRIRGIWFEDEYKRTYPYGSLACNVIGFANADGSNGNGGVEQYYNDTLVGVNGREYGYMDSDTKLQSVLKQPTDGETIVTTINTNIQLSLEKYLNEWQTEDVGSKVAAAVVMDPNTGEVLAMGSTNQYDLNNPRALDESVYTDAYLTELGRKEAVGVYKREHPEEPPISEDEVSKYYSQADIISYGKQVAWNQIWRNVMVSDTYEPGSTAKAITLAGALEERAITPDTEFNCEGYIELSDGVHSWKIRCHNHDGDGIIDAKTGLMRSCNVYLMDTAFALGSEKFVKYQHLFGFGEKTGIDLPAEADTSKLVYAPDKLGKTTLATNSFGQNYNVTMVQMAAAYCSIINGGSYYKPHVVKQILNSNGTVVENIKPEVTRITCSKSTSEFLKDALYQTVEAGTGTKAKIQGYRVGGKTGTAEKIPRSAKNYLVSFVGFAPVEDPQLLVYVIVDTPNLEGEAQATASFAINIEKKIMNDALQFMNIAPSSETDPADNLNARFAQNQEGISSDPMGEQATSASEQESSGDDTENQETLESETARETLPPVTDEFIQPADEEEGFGLPDEVPDEEES
ncbi:cell division protein FtsI/penicillin-binding protein 2 [Lachnospiraceae bacterium JC7]|nr:cell division protein FtsI/penicillin-binding protein 2 [Lachnospiraceae bacterium JC7]